MTLSSSGILTCAVTSLLIMLTPGTSEAQPRVVRAVVTDRTGVPIHGALIELTCSQEGKASRTTNTRSQADGRFQLEMTSSGVCKARIAAPGFASAIIPISGSDKREEIDLGKIRLSIRCSEPGVICDEVTPTSSIGSKARRQKNPISKEQSVFSAEDETVERPVSVPEDVLEILRKDERVLQYLAAEEQTPDELTTALFLASEIHLAGSNEIDLVVMGEGRLRGANVISFWVFHKFPRGYELILDIAVHDLTVKASRWNGYRIIETAVLTLSVGTIATFRFDGKRYRLHKTKSEPIG